MRGQLREPRSTAAGELPRLLNVEEVAEVLGVNVRHVRRLVFERRIPYVKWGRLVRFDPREIDRWLRDRAAAPAF
ncbi:MAG TPA: helix-turn-helix domain-containing protein [Acidimicrobiales bacterium]|nr:helix-turn-helix domain-containing protein [Acidimicrobiales bacterium]